MHSMERYKESAQFILERTELRPKIGIVLGSGLGFLADEAQDATAIDYREIPHFKSATVTNHAGRLVVGRLNGIEVALMQGRLHFYEGHSFLDTVYPIRVMSQIGVEKVILTNAAGGINRDFNPGDLMIICDHIKFFDDSPLRGPNIEGLGVRFPDMSYCYTPALREAAKKAALSRSIEVKEGVYAFMPGPQYETPAEICALRTLGADAVGMSTVAEAIAAAHCSMEVLGISCISNMAAGILDKPLSDEEVVETAMKEKERFSALILSILEEISR